MIRLWKILASFIIFYFIMTISSSVVELAKWMSFGNEWIELGFYGLLIVLFWFYMVIPWLDYTSRPSMACIQKMIDGDEKATKKIYHYYKKMLKKNTPESFKQIDCANSESVKKWVLSSISEEVTEMDAIIKEFALKLTAGVLISPNSFIDGLMILYGNSCMMYKLTHKVKIRYSFKELWNLYFAVMSVASITGLLEEFDDVIEDIFEELAEEFEELISDETGKNIGDSIPVLNILVKASSPIIQAASNYAFILYNGKRFKYKMLNLVNQQQLSDEEVRKMARKDARKAKYQYIEDMVKKVGLSGMDRIKKTFKSNKKKAEAPALETHDESSGFFKMGMKK